MSSKRNSVKGTSKESKVKEVAREPKLEEQRLTKLLIEAFDRAPEKARPYLRQAAPYLVQLWFYFLAALPYLAWAWQAGQAFVARLPEKVLYALLGFLVCFFGGVFPATIAAVEAWKLCGGSEAILCARELYAQFQKLEEASKKDDGKDDDKDGVADVDQISSKDLFLRKLMLVSRTVDPDRISNGVVGMYTGWAGVIAILKSQMARTLTLGESIGTQLNKPAMRLVPFVEEILPEDQKKWAAVLVRWSCKTIAVSIAWWTQRLISCIHSAVRGGLLFGRHLVDYLHETGVLPAGADKSNIDEAIGWGIAALGVIFQLSMGFGLPFPLNILLLPLRLLEGFIVWSATRTPF